MNKSNNILKHKTLSRLPQESGFYSGDCPGAAAITILSSLFSSLRGTLGRHPVSDFLFLIPYSLFPGLNADRYKDAVPEFTGTGRFEDETAAAPRNICRTTSHPSGEKVQCTETLIENKECRIMFTGLAANSDGAPSSVRVVTTDKSGTVSIEERNNMLHDIITRQQRPETTPGLVETTPGIRKMTQGRVKTAPGLKKMTHGWVETAPGMRKMTHGRVETTPGRVEYAPGPLPAPHCTISRCAVTAQLYRVGTPERPEILKENKEYRISNNECRISNIEYRIRKAEDGSRNLTSNDIPTKFQKSAPSPPLWGGREGLIPHLPRGGFFSGDCPGAAAITILSSLFSSPRVSPFFAGFKRYALSGLRGMRPCGELLSAYLPTGLPVINQSFSPPLRGGWEGLLPERRYAVT